MNQRTPANTPANIPANTLVSRCLGAALLMAISGPVWAQPSFQRDGDTEVIAQANSGEALQQNVNSAAAMDEDGNLSVAFLELGTSNRQSLVTVTPDGEISPYQSVDNAVTFFDTPTLSTAPGNILYFGHSGLNDDDGVDLLVDTLQFDPASNAQQKGSGVHSRLTFSAIRQRLKEELDCEPLSWQHTPAQPEYVDVPLIILAVRIESHGYYTFHCLDGRKFHVRHGHESDPPELFAVELTSLTGSGFQANPDGDSKGTIAVAPPTVGGALTSNGPVALFADAPPLGEENAIVSVVEFDFERNITRSFQLSEQLMTNTFGPGIAACGHGPGFDHYWITYIDAEDQAVLVRVDGDDLTYQTLGVSNVSVDVACDPWGNAVAAYWSRDENSIEVIALDASGGTIAEFSETLTGPAFSANLNLAINAFGHAALTWVQDNQVVYLQRYQLSNHVLIDGSASGSHFSPGYAGEGFAFDVVEIDGVTTLVVYYFTYLPDGSGEMSWLVGSAPLVNNRAVVPVATGSGATFGTGFDANDVILTESGTVTVTFMDCRHVLVSTQSNQFGNLRYLARRLTGRPLAVNGFCGDGPDANGNADGSQGGSIFDPQRAGEGFYFDIVEVGGTPTLVVYFFTYLPDGSGKPAWLVGSGPIEGQRARVEVGFGSGGVFGTDFDPSTVILTSWGTLSVSWISCTEIRIEYDGLWGSGTLTVTPLTAPLIGAIGVCS